MSVAEIEQLEMLATLIAHRSAAIEKDDAWEKYTDTEREDAFDDLNSIQHDILRFSFCDPKARLLALSVLLDGFDQPNFADDFKNRLFESLRKSAESY